MRYFFVVNPTAGKGRAQGIWDRLLHRLERERVDFGYALTSEPKEATYMTQDVIKAGYDAVVGVGGDGTLQEVAAGLDEGGALGVIPAGTGNDFSRSLGLPRDPERSLEMLLKARPVPVDRCRVNGKQFLNMAGVGFDALVAARVRERSERKRGAGGTVPYLMSVIRLFARYTNTAVTAYVDGRRLEATTLLIAVGNGAYLGGGMRMCPEAKIDDGLFDVCIVGDVGKTELVVNLPKIFRGTHMHHPKVTYLKARRICIDTPGIPCQADGEPVGDSPVEFEVDPGRLTLLMPTVN